MTVITYPFHDIFSLPVFQYVELCVRMYWRRCLEFGRTLWALQKSPVPDITWPSLWLTSSRSLPTWHHSGLINMYLDSNDAYHCILGINILSHLNTRYWNWILRETLSERKMWSYMYAVSIRKWKSRIMPHRFIPFKHHITNVIGGKNSHKNWTLKILLNLQISSQRGNR